MTYFWQRLGTVFRASTPVWHPDPRDETPEQALARLHHLDRSVIAVRNKIEKVYELHEDIASREHPHLSNVGEVVSKHWMHSHVQDEWLKEKPELQCKVAASIVRSTNDYIDAFLLHTRISNPLTIRPGTPHAQAYAQSYLFSLYTNHLANRAEARLIADGVDALTAHRINGSMIHHACRVSEDLISDKVYIDPAQKSKDSVLATIEQVDQLRSRWKTNSRSIHSKIESIRRLDANSDRYLS